jgi:putative addiction module component (TIGR02574 family)
VEVNGMANRLEEFERQAQYLSLREKSILIDHLINSLEEFDEIECDRLWHEEATRRYQDYKAGKVPSRSAEDVFHDTRAKLRLLP